MKVVRSSPLRTCRLYPQEYRCTHFRRLSRPLGTRKCQLPQNKFQTSKWWPVVFLYYLNCYYMKIRFAVGWVVPTVVNPNPEGIPRGGLKRHIETLPLDVTTGWGFTTAFHVRNKDTTLIYMNTTECLRCFTVWYGHLKWRCCERVCSDSGLDYFRAKAGLT